MTKTKSTNRTIQAAMRRNERDLLRRIRTRPFMPLLMTAAWWNAFDRLRASGAIKFDRRRNVYIAVKR